MNIGALDVRITIQKVTVTDDEYKNRVSAWEDYYRPWATARMTGGSEQGDAAIWESRNLEFTCRYCSELAAVNPKEYRVLLDGCVYNIIAVNPMGFQRVCVKLVCEKERSANA